MEKPSNPPTTDPEIISSTNAHKPSSIDAVKADVGRSPDASSEIKPDNFHGKEETTQSLDQSKGKSEDGFQEVPRKDATKKSYVIEEGATRRDNRSSNVVPSGRGRGRTGRDDKRLESAGRTNEISDKRRPGNDNFARNVQSSSEGGRGRDSSKVVRGPPPRSVTVSVSELVLSFISLVFDVPMYLLLLTSNDDKSYQDL